MEDNRGAAGEPGLVGLDGVAEAGGRAMGSRREGVSGVAKIVDAEVRARGGASAPSSEELAEVREDRGDWLGSRRRRFSEPAEETS
ncbi:MAG: hypothetical protein R3A79_03445 [Nannocystaceae bacterium]